MSNGAEKGLLISKELPKEGSGGGTGTVGLSVREVLELPALAGAQLVAGAGGLDGIVTVGGVMEVPDILPWLKPHELILTTGYPLQEHQGRLPELLQSFCDSGVAAVGMKKGRYLAEIPAEAVDKADALGLPIFMLDRTVAFDEILHALLTQIVGRQSQHVRAAEQTLRELVDIVVGGGSLDDVCSMVAGRIGCAAAVTAIEGRVLSLVGSQADCAALLALPCFDESGRFLVEDEPSWQSRHGGAQSDHHWGSVAVENSGRTFGRIVAFSTQPLSGHDFRLLEQAAAGVALVLSRDHSIAAIEDKYRADFLHEVLSGRAANDVHIRAHAQSLGWNLDRPVNVIVAEVDPAISDDEEGHAESGDASDSLRTLQELFATAWSRVIGQDDPQAAVIGTGDRVIALIDAGSTDSVTTRVEGYAAEVRGRGGGGRRPFSVGISRIAADVAGVPSAYAQAERALEVGRQLSCGQGLRHFDTLGVYRLLLQVKEQDELRRFAREVLGPLADDSRSENAELRATLQALLDHNLNVAETARAMFFHYNTLRYRIAKLERLLGPFTTDPNLRLAVALALQIVRLP